MSAEVVDSNPYSRLMALQRMGIVENYERIREFSIAIVVCIYLLLQYFFNFYSILLHKNTFFMVHIFAVVNSHVGLLVIIP